VSRLARLSPWGRLVAVSALLVLGSGIALGIARVASGEERLATYAVHGSLNGVALDLGDADVVVAGGGDRADVTVQRTDRSTFGHAATVRRSVHDGVFRIRSRCPETALHSCSVRYRIVVPDNVPVAVLTTTGTVRFSGYRGSGSVRTRAGDIRLEGFCGFSLRARSDTGDIEADAACPPQQLALRSTSGDVRAVVPDGRYQVDADSSSGTAVVRRVRVVQDGPFSVDASSSSGDVTVEARR
jgi:putative adhesin